MNALVRQCARLAVRSTNMVAPSLRFLSAHIQSDKLEIFHSQKSKPIPPKEDLVFGHEFSDHMLEIDWTKDEGWHIPIIRPFGDFHIHPAASVLHYGIECFEGMKAYVDADGEARLFRPMENMKRLDRSMTRLGLPHIDTEEVLECIKALVKTDKKWIPQGKGYSLYLRPTAISSQATLGVAPSTAMKLFCILSPVGPYFKSGFKAVDLVALDNYQRAWPGGTGSFKVGGNYAITIQPQMEAIEAGFNQILWLFGDNAECTEVGTMNFLCYWINEQGEKELITAPLDDGLILPGITRKSILELARGWDEFKVTERKFGISELIKAVDEGRVIECFGAGTACVVTPIKSISYHGQRLDIPLDPENPSSVAGKLTERIADTIMGIQYGEIPHEWSMKVE